MTNQQGRVQTKGASLFNPDGILEAWSKFQKRTPENDDFKSSIISVFNLPHNDNYVYHAVASVTLSQVQEAINHGAKFGLHNWYLTDKGDPVRKVPSVLPVSQWLDDLIQDSSVPP